MSRFVRPVLWISGSLAAGGLAFCAVLALNIPYRTAAAPETPPGTPSGTTSGATPHPPAPPATTSAWVTDVRSGADDHSAVLHVDLSSCAVGPHIEVTEAGNRIDAAVLFQLEDGPGCPQVPADFPMKTAAPIGKRPVIVNAGD